MIPEESKAFIRAFKALNTSETLPQLYFAKNYMDLFLKSIIDHPRHTHLANMLFNQFRMNKKRLKCQS